MRIHKEGFTIIFTTAAIVAAIVLPATLLLPWWAACLIALPLVLCWVFIISFFRSPSRVVPQDASAVFSPADGSVVVIEEVTESEYFSDRRIQVSVFMSIWNVHVNWFPVAGVVDYYRYHKGRYMVAWHPKSSEDNERTTIVVETDGGDNILFRQVAGFLARRIVSYAKVGSRAKQNSQCGFIKFGSRVDIFLPLDAEVQVKLGDKVTGTQTVIARLKSK